jgi:hypothetical protein
MSRVRRRGVHRLLLAADIDHDIQLGAFHSGARIYASHRDHAKFPRTGNVAYCSLVTASSMILRRIRTWDSRCPGVVQKASLDTAVIEAHSR